MAVRSHAEGDPQRALKHTIEIAALTLHWDQQMKEKSPSWVDRLADQRTVIKAALTGHTLAWESLDRRRYCTGRYVVKDRFDFVHELLAQRSREPRLAVRTLRDVG